jgi:hypothetical protein
MLGYFMTNVYDAEEEKAIISISQKAPDFRFLKKSFGTVTNNMASQQAPLSSPKDRNVDSGGRKQWPVYSPGLGRRKKQFSCVHISPLNIQPVQLIKVSLRGIRRERAVHARNKRRLAADGNLAEKIFRHTRG